jgi:hypothetical protein
MTKLKLPVIIKAALSFPKLEEISTTSQVPLTSFRQKGHWSTTFGHFQ